jgi:hypothetical protein
MTKVGNRVYQLGLERMRLRSFLRRIPLLDNSSKKRDGGATAPPSESTHRNTVL